MSQKKKTKKQENKPNFRYIFIPTTPEEDKEILAKYVFTLMKFANEGAAQ